MAARKTTIMLRVLGLILSLLLLTSCSNPDTSGGVTLSRGGDDGNEFPYGSCEGQGLNEHSGERTGCGWIHVNERSYYIRPNPGNPMNSNMELYKAKLSGADLTDANLRGADLREVYLEDAILTDAILTDSIMRFARLRRSDLTGANLNGAELSNTRLHDADLRNADLRNANLKYAKLKNAKLKGVKANSSTVCPNGRNWGAAGNDCGFYENDDEFPAGSCEGQSKNPPGGRTGCGWIHINNKSYYIMAGANLKNADLFGADLRYATLTNAILTDARLGHARLYRAELEGANLVNARLGDANLTYARLRDANLSGADLRGADLTFANRWSKAIWTNARGDTRTICPNGIKWAKKNNDCPF